MNRVIKFRAWDTFNACFYNSDKNGLTDFFRHVDFAEGNGIIIEQFTGLHDKKGNDIFEGDKVVWVEPYRTTQTHTGDNIPNGSYTEPMEPGIRIHEETIVFKDGFFGDDGHGTFNPISWYIHEWSEDDIQQAIAVHKDGWCIWDDPEEGDLQYLLDITELPDLQALINYLSGVEIIGNIHENKDLLK